MVNWKSETGQYIPRLEALIAKASISPPHPPNIPSPPLESRPSELQSILHRAVSAYEIGVWIRTKETIEAILLLWREGYLSAAASLARILFEFWGLSYYLTQAVTSFQQNNKLEQLSKVVNKVSEGVRSEVIMPWGIPASEKPVHVMDTIRELNKIYPQAIEAYDNLCESAHSNQPRYFEWWLLGKNGDNWTNQTVQKRGHILIEKTIQLLERCIHGINEAVNNGLHLCGKLY